MLIRRCFQLVLLLLLLTAAANADNGDNIQASTQSAKLVLLEVNDVISPAIADYLERNLEKAYDIQAKAVIIRMDTPGGLDLSMRQIIKRIIVSPIPVISYVAPGGARASSAGTYILYASHIAAMAPATNLGAATPVQIGGFGESTQDQDSADQADAQEPSPTSPVSQKMINDAAAYIRGLAKIHGRNQEWAEKAVREAASLSAEEALALNVIDIVATDIDDLVKQLHGREITVAGNAFVFDTEQYTITTIAPDWRNEFLAVITNPSIAYILLMVGIYGLVFEFSNPGSIVPGTVGGICLLLAFYALQLLPVNYAGMALILLGVALMIAEAFVPSIGILGLGGVIAFVIGSVILMDTDVPGFGIDLGLVAGFALSSAAFFIIAIGLVIKSRYRPIVSGKEEMLDMVGVAAEDFTGNGIVKIHSETWRARCDQPLRKNQTVKVKAVKGLLLQVIPFKPQEDE